LIKDVFPKPAATGRPPRDPRTIVNGILWILRTGAPWRDLPAEFGPRQTVWRLFNKWNANGTIDEILQRLQAAYADAGQIDNELWCVDGTTVRAHRGAGGGREPIAWPMALDWSFETKPSNSNHGWSKGLYPARSRHPGGVNHALADASVRFISETIDLTTYHGLGSRDGGEAISVP
jgi:transposase